MKILVTGGNGLLGSKISEKGRLKGYSTYLVDKAFSATGRFSIKQDICDKDGLSKVIRGIKPELIIHAAAITNVDECEKKKDLAWEVNVEGTRNIVEISRFYGSFLIYVSTDYIFSGKTGLYIETDKPDPINHYGTTKLEGERIVKKELETWCIARSSVIYGCNPATGKMNFALWALNNLRNNKSINVVVDQFVSPTLNTNLAEMILEVAERKLAGIYHLAGATAINRFDFVHRLAKAFSLDIELIKSAKIEDMLWEAKRPRNTSLDTSKASKTLQNKPMSLGESLYLMKSEFEK